jgi:tetratricopeptide (TPR) repeat protein
LANNLATAVMNKGVALSDLGRVEAAVAAYDEANGIYRRLVEVEGRGELATHLAMALFNLALARERSGELPTALAAAREAREIWERLVSEGWRHLVGALEKARKLEAWLRG